MQKRSRKKWQINRRNRIAGNSDPDRREPEQYLHVEYIGEACKIARKYFKVIGLEIYPVNSVMSMRICMNVEQIMSLYSRKHIIQINTRRCIWQDINVSSHIVSMHRREQSKAVCEESDLVRFARTG